MSPRDNSAERLWDLPPPPSSRERRLLSYDGAALASEPWKDLPRRGLQGHGDIEVCFNEPLAPSLSRDGDACAFALPELKVFARALSWQEAERIAADRIVADVDRLTRTFPDLLTPDETAQRRALLIHVDLLGGELGLDFPTDRRLLGRLRGPVFVPLQSDEFKPIPVPVALQHSTDDDTLWLARVACRRDGRPKGEVLELIASSNGET